MHCAVHTETEARGPCAVCFKSLCDACAVWELDGAVCCDRCGRATEGDAEALSSGLLALIGVGYLATLALGIVIWRPQPFVGGLAAIVAIGLGRAMQLLVKTPRVTRRAVDATAPPT